MSDIQQITVYIRTAKKKYSGTTDKVYLGFGGREFHLRNDSISAEKNFSRETYDTFILGDQSNVNESDKNDPRSPQLTLTDVGLYPVYIRKAGPVQGEDDNAWNVESVKIECEPKLGWLKPLNRLFGPDDIWLSVESGLILYIPVVADVE
jgi:hypothetical protein